MADDSPKNWKLPSTWAILSSSVTALSLLVLANNVLTTLDFPQLLKDVIEQYEQFTDILFYPLAIAYRYLFDIEINPHWRHFFLITMIWGLALLRLSLKYERQATYAQFISLIVLTVIFLILAATIDPAAELNPRFLIGYLAFFTAGGLFAREEGLNILGPRVPRLEMYWAFLGGYIMALMFFLAGVGQSLISG
ncbi:MAG: hypothetical protein AAF583_07510 [Pseudomonadota bacterium]